MAKSGTAKLKAPMEAPQSPNMLAALSPGGESPAFEGVIKVHESVVASIVRKATCQVEGVVRLAGSTLVDNIAEIVGSKKIYDRSITVEMGEGSVQVEVKVILAYGAYIPTVAASIQTSVIDQISKITGMSVDKVNVMVIDLEDLPQEGI